MLRGGFNGSGSRKILKCIGEGIAIFIVNGRVKRNRLLDEAEQMDDFIQVDMGSLSYVLWQGLLSVRLRELCCDTAYLAQTHCHMLWQMNQVCLINSSTIHR